MDEIQAAFLNVKLKHLKEDIEGRRRVAYHYLKNINNPKIQLPKVLNSEGHVWHLFVIRTRERDKLKKYLDENGIQSLIHYPIPPHKQEAFEIWNNMTFPITEKMHKEVLSLPISAVLRLDEVDQVIDIINSWN